jgi:hypothetical protein
MSKLITGNSLFTKRGAWKAILPPLVLILSVISCQIINTENTTCKKPTFTPAAGSYSSVQTVTISTTTESAIIYYTTDGSVPTVASTAYSAPITVGNSMTLRAIATKTDFSDSEIADAAYVITLPTISAFGFASLQRNGTINGTDIAVAVPFGTNVTALVASFTTLADSTVTVNGAVQTSGMTPNDFTNPVVYNVAVAGGASRNFTVTVTQDLNTAKDLTAFSLLSPAVTGTISGTNISLVVPYNTVVTGLKAVFTTTGDSVRVGTAVQTSGVTANDFTSPVTYTVTAADSSTKQYIVTVTFGATTWRTFTTSDGLAYNDVRSVYLQGTKIWAGTVGGANQGSLAYSLDGGTTWSNYTLLKDGSTPVGNVLGVYATGTHVYAPSYTAGLVYSDAGGALLSAYNTTNSLGANRVFGVAVSISGTDLTVYAATNNGLSISPLNPISTSVFTNYTTTNGLAANGLRCVSISGSTIYVGSTNGLSVSTTGGTSWTNYLSGQTILSIYASGSGIYAASNSGGLHVSTNGGTNWTSYTTVEGLGSNTTTGVCVVGSTIYVSTFGGLSVSTDACATWKTYTTVNGLASNMATCVFASGQDIYVGTGDGGLSVGH